MSGMKNFANWANLTMESFEEVTNYIEYYKFMPLGCIVYRRNKTFVWRRKPEHQIGSKCRDNIDFAISRLATDVVYINFINGIEGFGWGGYEYWTFYVKVAPSVPVSAFLGTKLAVFPRKCITKVREDIVLFIDLRNYQNEHNFDHNYFYKHNL